MVSPTTMATHDAVYHHILFLSDWLWNVLYHHAHHAQHPEFAWDSLHPHGHAQLLLGWANHSQTNSVKLNTCVVKPCRLSLHSTK